MRVAIHQPNYLPWMGYIEKIANSDIFVFFDDVQYSNQGGHNRNLIKTTNGKLFLTVPVEQHFGDKINEVRTKDELGWKTKHLNTITSYYKKAPYYHVVYPMMEELLGESYQNIAQMNEAILVSWSRAFGFKTEFAIMGHRESKVIDICCLLGADCYLSGHGARSYQVEEHFTKRGIQLQYQSYETLVYPQLWGEFIPNLSALDYIMNCGFDSGPILSKGAKLT